MTAFSALPGFRLFGHRSGNVQRLRKRQHSLEDRLPAGLLPLPSCANFRLIAAPIASQHVGTKIRVDGAWNRHGTWCCSDGFRDYCTEEGDLFMVKG